MCQWEGARVNAKGRRRLNLLYKNLVVFRNLTSIACDVHTLLLSLGSSRRSLMAGGMTLEDHQHMP